jgi:dGTPase
LGHTPFGHAGERALAEVFPGFRHNEQSLRVVDRIEKDGQGLNLTEQVRDGILRHSKPEGDITGNVSGRPRTPEAQVVKISDGVAYLNHDLDDAMRAGMLAEADIPPVVLERLGASHAERINTLVCAIVEQSDPIIDAVQPGGQFILMSDEIRAASDRLRDFLFERVYRPINDAESTRQAQRMLQWLYQHYATNPDQVPPEFSRALVSDGVERVAIDYVASMTDRFAITKFEALYVPKFWSLG